MKKRLLLVTIMFLSAGTLAMGATTGKIAGNVRDVSTGGPLPATNVILEGTTLGAAADEDGNYFIINVPPGDYTVRANIIGYTVLAVTDVRVSIDRTTTIDFTLEQATVAGEEVVVVAERPRIQKDVSFTQVTMSGDEVRTIPITPDLREVLAVSAGVTRDPMGFIRIRGGNYDEVGLYVDGFNSNDSRQGNPDVKVAKAEIQQIQILKGGFNAEYGKARTGIINIVTRKGGDKYSFSIENRFSPAARKHFGPSIYSPENYWFVGKFLALGPSEDRDGDGTPDFVGWTQWLADQGGSKVVSVPGMGDQTITSGEQALAIWKHQHPQWEYANNPDYSIEATLSGPVPFTKGKTAFVASAFYDKAYFFVPFLIDSYYHSIS